MKISPYDILYVTVVAQERSFSQAANKLLVSQPALSQAVQRLERKLGLQLFIRRNNKIYVTPAGEELISGGTDILRLSRQLEDKMEALRSESGHLLRIGSSPFYSGFHLSKILKSFKERYPDVKVELIERLSPELEEMVQNGELEVCLVPISPQLALDAQLNYQSMPPERFVFAVAENHPYTKKTPPVSTGEGKRPEVDLSLFKEEPFAFLKMKRFRKSEVWLCEQLGGFEPQIAYMTASCVSLYSIIRDGVAVGFLPENFVESLTRNERPAVYHINSPHAVHSFAIVSKKNTRLSYMAHRFIEAAQAEEPAMKF